MKIRAADIIEDILSQADIRIGGWRAWDIRINDERFGRRVLPEGSLGLGESYMDGWWDCDHLDEFFHRVLRSRLADKFTLTWPAVRETLTAALLNRQDLTRSYGNAQAHYDLGNDLYEAMLDKRLTYTCGYWKDADNLDAAQEAKLDLVCRKLGLQPGQTVLDIGCGWGSFVKFAAERYGARAVGITVSREQADYARRSCAGLPVRILLQDYRETVGTYDHVVSLGMFEHVGHKNYRTFMETARRSLAGNDGVFLLHTIGSPVTSAGFDPWLERYVFPGAGLPSLRQISQAAEGLFVIEDVHNFGADYDKTLMAWHANFERNWPHIRQRYDDRFRRMWTYYLLCCAGSFRARANQLWQIVMTKEGAAGGYLLVR